MFPIPGAPRALRRHAGGGGWRHVRHVGERSLRARCAQRPRDLALQPAAHRKAWPATRPAASIAAWRSWATACSWSPITRICSRCIASPASFCGMSRWPIRGQNYGSTSAPLVVNDLVIAGVSGGDEGVRGFLDAYKASTGERAWRFWTVPAPGEPGSETWSGRASEHGCGATWLTGHLRSARRGCSIGPPAIPAPITTATSARATISIPRRCWRSNPATGKLRWYYQFTPHDLHDWDATETPMLVDAQFHGQPRKLLLQGNRNGFFYVLDRLTRQGACWPSRSSRRSPGPAASDATAGPSCCRAMSRPWRGNWCVRRWRARRTGRPAPTARRPDCFIMFAEESCNIYTKNDQWWEAGKSFYGGGTRRAPGDDNTSGKFLKAIDIQTGKTSVGDPRHRRRDSGKRPDGYGGRADFLRRRQRRVHRGGRE